MVARTDYENEHVTRAAPRWAWNILDNALEGENPNSEDYEDIQNALGAIIDSDLMPFVQDRAETLDAVAEMAGEG